MKDLLYVMLLEKTKDYKKMNKATVIRHVDNIRSLDYSGEQIRNTKLIGVFAAA